MTHNLSHLLVAALLPVSFASSADHFDVVVYGGTSAGVAAALQTARMGKTTILIEPSQHIGGLTSGGLGMTDTGSTAVIGGISREFYQKIRAHYSDDDAWKVEKREDFPFYRPGEDALWRFEPKVAEKVYRDMLTEAKVTLAMGERLDLRGAS
jgi:flavin-dependent dehydrogenase